ncbi:MAG: CPBP family intramembrane metalloprotease [Myxococcales bacterium]|nr:CPBP family intramembrane metalloprotease [Myxococcales bacterium]
MLGRVAIVIALGLVAGGFGLGGLRVAELERSELDLETAARPLSEWRTRPDATRVSARMLTAELNLGERVHFELCGPQDLPPRALQDALSVAVLHLDRGEKMLLVPLDAPHMELVNRSARGACLPLGGGVIEQPGTHSMELVWLDEGEPSAAAQAVPLVGRVMARGKLVWGDRLYVVAVAAGALILLVAAWIVRPLPLPLPAPETTADSDHGQGQAQAQGRRRGAGSAVVKAAMCFLVLAGAMQLPLFGSSMTMVKAVVLATVQVGGAWLLVEWARGRSRWGALGLEAPAAPDLPKVGRRLKQLPWVVAAVAGAAVLAGGAQVAQELVPRTAEAPIQTFIGWPSGMLAFAAIGVLLPVVEEIFFRGFLYRSALPLGKAWAFIITVVLFVSLHAQQSWGNWGGLLAIAITGCALTGLRAASGSVLVPALAHLLYNFALSVASF